MDKGRTFPNVPVLMHTDTGLRNGLIRRTAALLAVLMEGHLNGMLGESDAKGIEENLLLFPAFEVLWASLSETEEPPVEIVMRVLLVTLNVIEGLEDTYWAWQAELLVQRQ